MKNKIKLVFAVHNHQPVGNFDHVFKECFDKCYKPFLKVLKRHPKMKISIHFTGSLLEWIEHNENDYFERLNELIKREQIELMGGGFYEPLLAMLPKRDAVGQIRLQTEYLKKHFSCNPKGAWLAERVWDASIPEILAEAGINYTIIDDTHFKYAGFNQEDIHGYYISEKIGSKVNVFPIDKNLRYMIPFVEPQKVIEYLGLCAENFPDSSVCYADDGEKFGVWPGTYNTCYEERWLDRFFELLQENADWIEVKQAQEIIACQNPNGLVYLPDASYEEMLEWALPLNAAFRYKIMKKNLETENIYGQFKDFIRGGIWPNFLVKYPESNLMYRRMLYVSEQLNNSKLPKDKFIRATAELYMGQCNCSYWHGLFGGLYLNYLRNAIYKHLIMAENIIIAHNKSSKHLKITQKDYISHGLNEIIVSNKEQFSVFSPQWGGGLVEIDYRPKAFNFSNIMTRRKEVYHIDLIKNREDIYLDHGDLKFSENVKEEDRVLESAIFYDKYNRYSFLDHFFPSETKVEDFIKCRVNEYGSFHVKPYEVKNINSEGFTLVRNGTWGKENLDLSVKKQFIFHDQSSKIKINYKLKNNSMKTINTAFGVEFNYTLLAGKDEGRFYEINDTQIQGDDKFLISYGETLGVDSISLVDLWMGLRLKLKFDKKAKLYRFPVETVSQSESGFERSYQASCIIPSWDIDLEPQQEIDFSIDHFIVEEI